MKNKYDELNKLYSNTLDSIEIELARQYRITAKTVVKEMAAFYDKLQASNQVVIVSDLYKYDRYYKLLKELNRELSMMGEIEIEILDRRLETYATKCAKAIDKKYNFTAKLDTELAKEVVNRVWVSDGKNYSDRIWTNKKKLLNTLEQGLFKCVVTGANSDDLIREITDTFNINYKVAKRLVRTEMSYVQTKTALDRYKANGIKQYKYLTQNDDKVCEYCDALNNNIFDVDKAEFSINCPPSHPNCRCLIAPVVNL